jgi:hypothetical protein
MRSVMKSKKPLLLIDTKSFRVSKPGTPAPPGEAGRSWLPFGVGSAGLVLLAGAGAALIRRRQRLAPT